MSRLGLASLLVASFCWSTPSERLNSKNGATDPLDARPIPTDAVQHPTDAAATSEKTTEGPDECWLVRVLADGNVVVRRGAVEQTLKIYGIDVPQPVPDLYVEMLTRGLPKPHKPLRFAARSTEPSGEIVATLFFYAWQDKSGDVWLDLAAALLGQGAARVAKGDFPERAEYLKHEKKARTRKWGIWAKPTSKP